MLSAQHNSYNTDWSLIALNIDFVLVFCLFVWLSQHTVDYIIDKTKMDTSLSTNQWYKLCTMYIPDNM